MQRTAAWHTHTHTRDATRTHLLQARRERVAHVILEQQPLLVVCVGCCVHPVLKVTMHVGIGGGGVCQQLLRARGVGVGAPQAGAGGAERRGARVAVHGPLLPCWVPPWGGARATGRTSQQAEGCWRVR
jgi:hypothetical protein